MSTSPGRAPISNVGIENVGSTGFTRLSLERTVTKSLCFSAHKIFTTRCASFPNRISHFKVLAMPWSMCFVHCLREPERALRFSEFGSRKQIFDI